MDMNGRLQLTIGQTEPVVLFAKGKKTNATIKGIDFALTALFVTVFCDQWIHSDSHFAAIAGVLASILCIIIFGADGFLIPTMILILVILSVAKLIKGKERSND